MGSLASDWKHLLSNETSQKSFIKTFCYNCKVTNKVTKRLPKLFTKEIYFTLLSNINSNSTKYNLSNSFHGQPFLRNTIFSVLISTVKLLLIHNWLKKCWWIASYIFSILYNRPYSFFSSFKPCNTKMTVWTTHQILFLGCKKTKRVSILIYILLEAFQNFSRLLTSEIHF